MYPNPASQHVSIRYELLQPATVEIELFDMLGNKVKTISSQSHQDINKYTHTINISDLSLGVYFVNVKVDNTETILKLIITD